MAEQLFSGVYEAPKRSFYRFTTNNNLLTKSINNKIWQINIIFVIIILLSIILAMLISKSITNPIKKLQNTLYKIAKGNVNVNLPINRKDEIGELSKSVSEVIQKLDNIGYDIKELLHQFEDGNISYRIEENKYGGIFNTTVNAINSTTTILINDSLYIVAKVKEFGNDEFNKEIIEFPGEKGNITSEIKTVQSYLKNVSTDIIKLIKSANEGNLSIKLDTTNYIGEWKEIIGGLNLFTENVVNLIQEAQYVINEFAKGNFHSRMIKEYQGDFNVIKTSINSTVDQINSYISEISDILTKVANKNFNVSIDKEYIGDFKDIEFV